jgi:hypothetical protein
MCQVWVSGSIEQWSGLSGSIQLDDGDRLRFGDLRNDAHIGVGQLLKRERMSAVLVYMAIGEA